MAANKASRPNTADELAVVEATIARGGRLHWFHWTVVILSLLLTLGAWYVTKKQSDEKIQEKFEREVQRVVDLVDERMQKYEDGLWGGVSALLAAGGSMSHTQWRTFAESLRLDLKYPGINGIGVILNVPRTEVDTYLREQRNDRPGFTPYPEHDRDTLLPITYIEPVATNREAVGLDMAHERNRYTAAMKARQTGLAQITGPIVLVQDAGQTPGFLFYAPFYRGGAYLSEAERREHFGGVVYAPFVVERLMRGTLEQDRRQVDIRISDGDEVLYDEHSGAGRARTSPFRAAVSVPLYGRTWNFDVRANQAFLSATLNHQPLFILLGGITIDSLLLTLFVLLSRSNRRAVRFARRVTEQLRTKAKHLERSNAELNKFAYVASHDLKAPLRGISGLVAFIEEDLADHLADAHMNPDVHSNFRRVHEQIARMENLVQGLLKYASTGSRSAAVAEADTLAMVREIGLDLGLSEEQLIVDASLPSFHTDGLHLQQVFANLIGNAIRYHGDREQARIRVSAEEQRNFYAFSVADNGPGIDPTFWNRIFEVFQSLQPNNDGSSTGIGLAIVKKAVEAYGGKISVDSVVGEGSTFTFLWPKVIDTSEDLAA